MPSSAKPASPTNPAASACGIAARLAPLVLVAVLGAARGAAADDRCTGTLCDLYYAARPAQPSAPAQPASTQDGATQPAAPTPVTVPSGGGILNFFRGGAPDAPAAPAAPGAAPTKPFMYLTEGTHYDRCTGTLCDAYYGVTSPSSPAPAPPQAQQASAKAPGGTALTPRQPAPTAEQVALAKAMQQRRAAQEAREQANAKCRLAAAGDPWHCFR